MLLKVVSVLALAAVAAGMEEIEGSPRVVMRIKMPVASLIEGGMGEEMPMFPLSEITKAFSSSSSLLDDFGHESLFDEIFPQSHNKVEMFPSFRRIDNDGGGGGLGGFGGFLSNIMSGMMSGAMRRGGFHRSRVIDLSQPMDEAEEKEGQEKHCCCKDMHAHCANVQHDGTVKGVFALTKCLARRQKDHHDVESFCAAKVAQTVAGACLDDIATYCPKLQPGQSKIHSCLYRHQDALAPTCKKYMHVAVKQLPIRAITATSTVAPEIALQAQQALLAEAEKATAAAAQAHPFHKAAPTKVAGTPQQRSRGAPTITLQMQRDQKLAATAAAAAPQAAASQAPKLSKSVYIALGCVGAVLVAAVAALIVSRSRRSAPDNSAYTAMLI